MKNVNNGYVHIKNATEFFNMKIEQPLEINE